MCGWTGLCVVGRAYVTRRWDGRQYSAMPKRIHCRRLQKSGAGWRHFLSGIPSLVMLTAAFYVLFFRALYGLLCMGCFVWAALYGLLCSVSFALYVYGT